MITTQTQKTQFESYGYHDKKSTSLILVALITILCALPAHAASDSTEIVIPLSDSGIKANGLTASTRSSSAVYTGAAFAYYESGHDATYGEGASADEHSTVEEKKHTVVTITKPGTYRVSGKLSAGQIAVDLCTGPDRHQADVLDMTTDEVKEAVRNAKVGDLLIAASKVDEFKTAYLSEVKTKLDAAVTAGALTQTEADEKCAEAEAKQRSHV